MCTCTQDLPKQKYTCTTHTIADTISKNVINGKFLCRPRRGEKKTLNKSVYMCFIDFRRYNFLWANFQVSYTLWKLNVKMYILNSIPFSLSYAMKMKLLWSHFKHFVANIINSISLLCLEQVGRNKHFPSL